MRRSFTVTASAVACAAALACTPTEVELSEIAGSWTATSALFSDLANPNDPELVELISLGWVLTLDIMESGDFTLTVDEPGEPQQTLTGTMTVDGVDLTATVTGQQPSTGEVFLEADQLALRLTAGEDLNWDFNGDGEDEPALLLLVMDRI